jgi:hypothetical protein
MSKAPPLMLDWDGEVFRPSGKYWARQADEHFVVGERYRLVEENERSNASHAHEFAFLTEAWNSLPDHLLPQYPNSEVLRKHGLIAKGFCTMVQHVCTTKAEADRLAAILKPYDQYAIVVARGNVVTVYTAVSQSRRAMGAAQFQQSKTALMEFVGDLLGVDPETIGKVEKAA